MEKADYIQKLVDEKLNDTIIESYRTPERREENENTTIGTAIAHWTHWDGLRIMGIFFEALEDANFHTEAAEVQKWIEKEKSE